MPSKCDGLEPVSLGLASTDGETAKAVSVLAHGLCMSFWLPKSAIHPDSDILHTGVDPTVYRELVVYRWYAEKEFPTCIGERPACFWEE